MSKTLGFIIVIYISVIQMTLPNAFAQQLPRFGDWYVNLSNPSLMTEAFTSNESGDTFGLVCVTASNKCRYYVNPGTICATGMTSVILINAMSGAISTSTDCTRLGNRDYNLIEDNMDMNDVVIRNTFLRFAIPMQNSLFKVVQFSLRGANQATTAALQGIIRSRENRDHMK